jgi:hypothetical protein
MRILLHHGKIEGHLFHCQQARISFMQDNLDAVVDHAGAVRSEKYALRGLWVLMRDGVLIWAETLDEGRMMELHSYLSWGR